VVDDELKPLPASETGTLAFGLDYPGFFLGYLGDAAATSKAMRGGYFVTSDLARMDADGYVFIVGRADDCFKSKGVLIAPRELEDAILGLGRFEEACVFPIPTARSATASGLRWCRAAGRATWTRQRLQRRLRARSRRSSSRTVLWSYRNCPRMPTARLSAARLRAWRWRALSAHRVEPISQANAVNGSGSRAGRGPLS
jgi:acyl-coenzyme A synthetase/AMP-(fatty) acid ligase